MNEYVITRLQEQNIEILVKNKGFKFTESFFPYTSGEIGPYYINSECVMKNPEDYQIAVKSISHLTAEKMKAFSEYTISGGESRDWIFSNPTALFLKKPSIMIYKNRKIIPGDSEIKGKRFCHIADLNNEGSSPNDLWIPAIRKPKGIIENIVFYVDRLEEGINVMQKLGLKSNAVVPLDEHAWDYLKKEQIVQEEIYKNLMERGKTKHERDDWAIKMLRSEKGLKNLIELINNQKTIDKAAKILSKGYPQIEIEIRERLKEKLEGRTYIDFWDRIVVQRREAGAKK